MNRSGVELAGKKYILINGQPFKFKSADGEKDVVVISLPIHAPATGRLLDRYYIAASEFDESRGRATAIPMSLAFDTAEAAILALNATGFTPIYHNPSDAGIVEAFRSAPGVKLV